LLQADAVIAEGNSPHQVTQVDAKVRHMAKVEAPSPKGYNQAGHSASHVLRW
jgi:ribosomal protein L6P/L9E